MTETSRKAQEVRILDKILCIYYLIQFQRNKGKDILALLNFGSKVNAMTPSYIAQLDIKVQKTNVSTQKIDISLLETYRIVIMAF